MCERMTKDHFASFYHSLHGYAPFPWQVELAARVAMGRWPDALNLPTSAGKTAIVDVWLWAHVTGVPGTPRRLYYVIDRRLLVDAVADYAQKLFERVSLQGSVVRMRGGLGAKDDAWMLNPAGVALISTTLDQLGSRLLCRAFGASRWAAPVHAGLAGNDALIVIDEAHLVEPFRQTLQRIGRFRGVASDPMTSPWHVVTMTATPLGAGVDVLALSDGDRANPVLRQRLLAEKRARLLNGKLGDLALEAIRLRLSGAAVVGVVVNTVDTARMVHRTLSAHGETMLIIGRARPLERDALGREVMQRAGSGTRSKERLPLFVVATQTIEVGLDLDFDALVSELAPFSALRQRLGRLDRLGELGTSHASIVKVPAARWPYAKTLLDDAWEWLEARAEKAGKLGKVVNVGISAQDTAPPEPALRSAVLGLPDLHVLFDPAIDMDITPYLHGEKRSTEVLVAWRSALDEVPPDEWTDIVEGAPPSGLELMPIPLHTLKRWLAGETSVTSDLESTALPDEAPGRHEQGLRVICWDGERAELVIPSALRSTDVVVLPASMGGCDRFGWNPASAAPVRDLYAEGLIPKVRWTGSNERTLWAIGLAEHMAGVGKKASTLATACGFPAYIVNALEEAGRLHDLGKNDPRFQLMLGAYGGPLLAKSGSHEVAVARKLAGLPRGWRHELASVAQRLELDPLVRYLIGSHHGRGRPWMPASADPKLWLKAQAGDWPALATHMQGRFGFWGLCYLEALLRLADWARSSEEQEAAQLKEIEHEAA